MAARRVDDVVWGLYLGSPNMRHVLPLLIALLALSFVPLQAQVPTEFDPGRSVRSRADLERLLAEYDQALASPAYSSSVKQAVRASAEQIRARLEHGDFRVGDAVALYVEGESTLPDTIPVESGPMISLPLFGDISLAGVLRSETREHLTKELSRFIHEPVVRASALMRLSIQGQVGNPGFFVVPADELVTEALMRAGGPGPNADLDRLRIERGAAELIAGRALQEAMREGRTLDQLNLQAGDQIVVPDQATSGGLWTRLGAVAGVVGSLSFLLLRIL